MRLTLILLGNYPWYPQPTLVNNSVVTTPTTLEPTVARNSAAGTFLGQENYMSCHVGAWQVMEHGPMGDVEKSPQFHSKPYKAPHDSGLK